MIAFVITTTVLITALFAVFFFSWKCVPAPHPRCTLISNKLKRVAVLVDEHDSHSMLHVKHFTEQLSGHKNFTCAFERHIINPSSFQDVVHNVIDSQASLVYIHGLEKAHVAHNLCIKAKRKIPILFAETDGAVLQETPFETHYPIKGIVQTPPDFNEHLSSIKKVLPHLSNILLICGSSSNINRKSHRYSQITNALEEHSLSFESLYTSGNDDIVQRVGSRLDQFDVVTVLYDVLTAHQLSDILQVCAANKTPLFATDLSALDQGATFAFGATISTISRNLAGMAATFLTSHITWNTPSIVHLDEADKLFINEKMLEVIGRPLDPNLSIILKYADMQDRNVI